MPSELQKPQQTDTRWWVYSLGGLAFIFLLMAEGLRSMNVSSLRVYPGDGSDPIRISANYQFEVEIVATVQVAPAHDGGAVHESIRTVHTDSCSELVNRTSSRSTLWVPDLHRSLFYDTFSQRGCEASRAIHDIIVYGAYLFFILTFPLGFLRAKTSKLHQLGLPILAIVLGGFVMALMGSTAASLSHGVAAEAYVYGGLMIVVLAAYIGDYCLLFPSAQSEPNSDSKNPLLSTNTTF